MSKQDASPSQAASLVGRSPTPPADRFVFLDEVDVREQAKIQTRIARTLESTYEAAIEEAIRRSLSSPDDQSSQTDIPQENSAETAAIALAIERSTATGTSEGNTTTTTTTTTTMDTAMNCEPSQSTNSIEDDAFLHRGAAASAETRSPTASVNSRPHLGVGALQTDGDTHLNGLPDVSNIDLNDADNEGDDDDDDRSRRGRFLHHHQGQHRHSERRPSLDRIHGGSAAATNTTSERRPSLDRMNSAASNNERRPSLDRMLNRRSERRPSLEMRDGLLSERRPSLDRLEGSAAARSERRPSLEQIEGQGDRSERRASLEMIERRVSGQGDRDRERRPSLERVDQRERRASLDRMQSAEECLQSISSPDSVSGPAQGINTLRPWPLNDMGIPTNWDPTRLPGDGDGLYQLVELSPVDREYSAVSVDFEEAGLKVVSVERLQNTMLLERFNHEKEHLLKMRPPDFELNERYLYHGTQANKQRLSEEGLDHRLSFQGCFGRGIYFSDNPRKCIQYATSSFNHARNENTHPMILVCRVLLGESKVYSQGIKDSDLKREPEKPRAKGGWRYYDSVQGIPVDYPEFVVYDNRRSMIEYIVTFEEVAYRAPPAVSNFYVSQVPQLYKVEPITLPIPEDELDRMYMLCPDTDSDGSCDEHTREVERLRDNVKRAKAKRLGIPYRPPTKEEKRYERLHWKRVCYYSCPPGSPLFQMMIIKKKEEKAERMKRKAEAKAKKDKEEGMDTAAVPGEGEETLGAVGGSTGSTTTGGNAKSSASASTAAASDTAASAETEDYEVENDSVAEVLSTLIAQFLDVTQTDNVTKARRYILDNNMEMDKALCQFFREME